jgi:hypothetical protein
MMMAGRPGKYDTHVKPKLLLIEAWARDGLTDEQIAANLGISIATYYVYKSENIEFSDALKRGKEEVDIMVENALFKRAMGYTYEEVTHEAIEIKTGSGDNIVYQPATKIKTVLKEVVPDTTAQIFWLKNRKPKEWRDKQEIEHSGSLDVDIDRMDDSEILAGIEATIQAINNLKK